MFPPVFVRGLWPETSKVSLSRTNRTKIGIKYFSQFFLCPMAGNLQSLTELEKFTKICLRISSQMTILLGDFCIILVLAFMAQSIADKSFLLSKDPEGLSVTLWSDHSYS